jgi:Uma2 family endonuclease
MTGLRLNHNFIAGNGYAFLKQALRGRNCKLLIADVKVHVDAANTFFYPDLAVTCDPRDQADPTALAIHHPWLIVEVLSESTAAYDRGVKFEHYRQLASLTHYLLVEQTRAHVDLFQKNAQGRWELYPLDATDTIHIEQPHAFSWPVATLFDDVAFEPGQPSHP